MRAPSLQPLLRVLFLLALSGSTLPCRAYTYIQVGVDSNFLIDGNRVLFAQADRSLTVLALDSGEVLQRDKSRDYSGTLLRTSHGLLVLNSSAIALLNATNFNVLWEIKPQLEPDVADDRLVSCDGDGKVECRSLSDGRVRWTYDLTGALEIVAAAGRVLVHHSAVYEEGTAPAIALLDLDSGKELFRKAPPFGTNWASAFFDGTNLYVETGPFSGKRSDYKPEWLAIWNTRGEEIGAIPIPAELRDKVRYRQLFDLDGKTFWQGRVYANRQSIPYEKQSGPITISEKTNGIWKTFQSDYDLGDGISFVERVKDLSTTNATAYAMEIEWRAPTNNWKGVLTYLVDRGRIAAIATANGKLLVGTDLGHVECINAANGESLWLYLFPTLHRTMSSSAQGRPPTMSEAAAIFRQENRRDPDSGLQIVGGNTSRPRVVTDPEPVDPFRRLPYYVAAAWSGAAIPLVILFALHVAPRTRQWGSGTLGLSAAWLTFLLYCGYVFFGRISPGSSLALKISIAIALALLFGHTLYAYQCGRRFQGTVLALIFAGVVLFML